MDVLVGLTLILQNDDMEIEIASEKIREACAKLNAWIADGDDFFLNCWTETTELSSKHGLEPTVPRKRGRKRGDEPAELSPAEYLKKNLAVPYLDKVIKSLEHRLELKSRVIPQLGKLIPSKAVRLTSVDCFKELCVFYAADLVDQEGFLAEVWNWINFWKESNAPLPSDAVSALRAANRLFSPRIITLLQVYAVIPVTTAQAERSFSVLRRIKTHLRSSMASPRNNHLCVLATHK